MSDISLRRHLFTEAFAYDLSTKNKAKKTVVEITRIIPFISFPENTANFIDALKDRVNWEKDITSKRFTFEEEFSNYRLFRYVVHAIGLGILFIPVRIVATKMKESDEKHGRRCPYDSPYHPSLDSSYVSPPNIKRHTTNQMFDFEHLRKYGVDPEKLKEDVLLRIEFNRWKSTQNR